MTAKSTERYWGFLKRQFDKGLVRLTVWVKPEDKSKVREFIEKINNQSGS